MEINYGIILHNDAQGDNATFYVLLWRMFDVAFRSYFVKMIIVKCAR